MKRTKQMKLMMWIVGIAWIVTACAKPTKTNKLPDSVTSAPTVAGTPTGTEPTSAPTVAGTPTGTEPTSEPTKAITPTGTDTTPEPQMPTRMPTTTPEQGPVEILPVETPTATPSQEPQPTPEGVTAENRAKIDASLKELDGTARCARVQISFGDVVAEGKKLFEELFPEEYLISKGKSRRYSEVPGLTGDLQERVWMLCAELRAPIACKWFDTQVASFFEKYPELTETRVKVGTSTMLVLEIPYSTMLLLSKDSQILQILPLEEYNDYNEAKIIGEYCGHKVYDVLESEAVFNYYDYLLDDWIRTESVIESYLGWGAFHQIEDSDYLRVSIIVHPADEVFRHKCMQLRGFLGEFHNDEEQEGFVKWSISEEGKAACQILHDNLVEQVMQYFKGLGWPVLEEGCVGDTGKRLSGERYITVLVTKEQLKRYVPGIALGEYWNDYPSKWALSNDSYHSKECDISLYWSGVVHSTQK